MMSRHQANALAIAVSNWESIKLGVLERVNYCLDVFNVVERSYRHGHNLLRSDKFVAHWHFLV